MFAYTQSSIFAFAGLASHVLLFIRGEWHLQAPILSRIFLALFAALVVLGTFLNRSDFWLGLQFGFTSACIYCTALFTSIITYRTLLHPLRKVPGPPLAKVSKLWQTIQCVSSKNHLLLDSLHRQYGTFVRTGTCQVNDIRSSS